MWRVAVRDLDLDSLPGACRLGVRASRMVSSQVMENNLNPKWDEDFKLLVHEPEHQVNTGSV